MRATTSGAFRPAAWGLVLLTVGGALAGCQGRSDAGRAAALAPSTTPAPVQTSAEPIPETPAPVEPTLAPTPALLETLPREDVTGQPIHDLHSDTAAFVYPDSLDESERANATIWIEQQRIVAQCMLDEGFDYTYTLWWERPSGPRPAEDPLSSALYPAGSPGSTALYGEETGLPYDWTTAGCHGYAVHATGQDDAN
ncbi:hypothetical protein GSU68_10635 [Rathayibacter sp. VKM Ac-2759]|uniref:hypothetical protein n=1 Tax=Rathayibacter sp. VKM Ac-2759 TaxID=2609252 RepID=UPI001315F276|nr:hypothetical protein [Rathayibacter sp. VKM Ac-2759]QHC66970.1 hypothetical protein GSU68_10635 [Rathayibacter sp. VKM Ac-2759]